MLRLLIHVEGQTEEKFVNELLREHLSPGLYQSVSARIVGNARLRAKRGGIRAWSTVKADITNHLKQDVGAVASLLVDYYALPMDWPGRREAPLKMGSASKAKHIEAALLADISSNMPGNFDGRRFVPFITMYEFEGLLFSDPQAFARAIYKPELEAAFLNIRQSFVTPEDINDSAQTAPSKRVLSLYADYDKPLFGTIVASAIGLTAIRNECPHFNDWLTQIEELSFLDV